MHLIINFQQHNITLSRYEADLNPKGFGINNGYEVYNISKVLIPNILGSSLVMVTEFSCNCLKGRTCE
jgi:hypothetical protein